MSERITTWGTMECLECNGHKRGKFPCVRCEWTGKVPRPLPEGYVIIHTPYRDDDSYHLYKGDPSYEENKIAEWFRNTGFPWRMFVARKIHYEISREHWPAIRQFFDHEPENNHD